MNKKTHQLFMLSSEGGYPFTSASIKRRRWGRDGRRLWHLSMKSSTPAHFPTLVHFCPTLVSANLPHFGALLLHFGTLFSTWVHFTPLWCSISPLWYTYSFLSCTFSDLLELLLAAILNHWKIRLTRPLYYYFPLFKTEENCKIQGVFLEFQALCKSCQFYC